MTKTLLIFIYAVIDWLNCWLQVKWAQFHLKPKLSPTENSMIVKLNGVGLLKSHQGMFINFTRDFENFSNLLPPPGWRFSNEANNMSKHNSVQIYETIVNCLLLCERINLVNNKSTNLSAVVSTALLTMSETSWRVDLDLKMCVPAHTLFFFVFCYLSCLIVVFNYVFC